jgi:crotonobetainyl-CoA:carnitine CoA-transferase CaiB-like acyl-CoA transferase
LFETTVYLVGQHMAQKAVTGQAAKPMPVRISAWAIYDVFETRDGEQVFVGVVSDSLWEKFCAAFELRELGADPQYRTNAQRVRARETLLPQVREVLKRYAKADLVGKLERTGLPFAPIGKPEELFDDPHLLASGGLGDVTLEDGRTTQLPLLPVELDGARPTQGGILPRVGQHTRAVLQSIGVDGQEFERLQAGGVIQ